MILVDSSVWIKLLRDPSSAVFQQADRMMDENKACTCGVIIQEVLQGFRDFRQMEEMRVRMLLLPYLEETRETYVAAATLFRRCRQREMGVHTVDVLIMALAIQHAVPVFTFDADFTKVASLEKSLQLYR